MASTAQLVREIGPLKLGMMGAVALAVMAALVILSVRLSAPSLVPLFSNLSPEDSARILSRLDRMGMYYQINGGGAQIMVPTNKVLSARMQMAEEGLPAAGATVGYEIFDREEKLGVSGFVYNVNLVRALEGELGRTIGSFDKVAGARVHLVLPKRDLFARRSQDPSASVVLRMRGLEPLDRGEIDAISHLVATAVPGLSVHRITIVDTHGRPFKKGAEDPEDPGSVAEGADEYRAKVEKRIKNILEDLIGRSVGVGRVEAQVTADVDFDYVVTNSERFDPDSQVARSVQTTESRDNSVNSTGGDVSVANNVPPAGAEGDVKSKNDSQRTDSVTNFELSKTTQKIVKGVGSVKKLSVAILVDGQYTFDEAKGDYVYSPRPQEELDKLEALARSAVGFDEKRGDALRIVNMAFSRDVQGIEPEKPFEWIKRDLGSIVQTLMIGVVVTLIILLVVRPIVSRAFEIGRGDEQDEELMRSALTDKELEELAEITAMDESAPQEEEDWLSVTQFEDKMKDSSVSAINDIIERHPQEAVTVLRNWLEKGE
ncbi:MAG: flagellar basal-body MS-ring/collar protein FliF [Rickettsiales bacterium]